MQTLLTQARSGCLVQDVLHLDTLTESAELRTLLSRCLSPDTTQRPSARAFIESIEAAALALEDLDIVECDVAGRPEGH
jgi:hypothetical protein